MTSSGSLIPAATADQLDQQLAERAVLGAAIHDWPSGARAQVLTTARADDFTDPRAMATWRALVHLARHDSAIDEVTVAWQGLRTRHRFGDVLTIQELREARPSALFHEAAAATLARSTLIRAASQAGAATTQCAQEMGIDLATVIDSVTSHHIAVGAATGRLAGRLLAYGSIASLPKRLLDRNTGVYVQHAVTVRPGRHCSGKGAGGVGVAGLDDAGDGDELGGVAGAEDHHHAD